MMVVSRHIVLTGWMLMAGGAKLVALILQPGGMRVVTVGAANPLGVHFALQERSVDIDLVLDLPIRMIKSFAEQGGFEEIEQFFSRPKIGRHAMSSCVTRRPRLNLYFCIFTFEAG